jgi:hypothetical protein
MGGRRAFLSRAVVAAAGVPFAGAAGARTLTGALPPAAPAVDLKGSVLASLLARDRQRHPGGRTNHTCMALLSLAALGAPPDRIRSLGEAKLEGGRPFPAGGPAVTRQNWHEQLGNPEALPGLRALFDQEIARRGVAWTLRRYLPALLPGLGAHAFHPLIRTGYGVRFGDPAEVAMGLAYWAITFLPLGPLTTPGPHDDPAAALAAVRQVPLLTPEGRKAAAVEKPDGLSIATNIRWASTLTGFGPAASALRMGDASLTAIARAMVRLHAASNNFTALHAVTGTHAYRLLEPFVGDRVAGRRHLWQALVAAYVSIGAPALAAAPAPPRLPPWTEVVAKAAASDDDHDLKLTDIAQQEARHYQDPTYLHSAAVHLDLV